MPWASRPGIAAPVPPPPLPAARARAKTGVETDAIKQAAVRLIKQALPQYDYITPLIIYSERCMAVYPAWQHLLGRHGCCCCARKPNTCLRRSLVAYMLDGCLADGLYAGCCLSFPVARAAGLTGSQSWDVLLGCGLALLGASDGSTLLDNTRVSLSQPSLVLGRTSQTFVHGL